VEQDEGFPRSIALLGVMEPHTRRGEPKLGRNLLIEVQIGVVAGVAHGSSPFVSSG
jgi:hypothetical protein